jgi:transcriptional regulator GlxA family with amidase domain
MGGPVSSSCGLTVATDRFEPKHVETVLFVGSTTCHDKRNLRQAGGLAQLSDVLEDRETRAGSVGTGTFSLAATGLLDGRIAASASRDAMELQRQFPKVKVVCSEAFTRDGPVWTSPNISAATGMILAMVEEDNGQYLSNVVAQSFIAYRPRVRKHPCSPLNQTHG